MRYLLLLGCWLLSWRNGREELGARWLFSGFHLVVGELMDHGLIIPAWSVAAHGWLFWGEWKAGLMSFWRVWIGEVVYNVALDLFVSLPLYEGCRSLGLGMGLRRKMIPGCIGGLCACEMESRLWIK